MTKVGFIILFCAQYFLFGCAVKTPVTNQYKIAAFSCKKPMQKKLAPRLSVLISQPEAVAGYQTEQMLYLKKPFELTAFSKNSWVSTPANMLFPLIVQSMQHSDYFFAVATTPYADKADYRVDTQLLGLHQSFLVKPSVIQLTVKVVITHIEDNRVISSRIFRQCMSAPEETPYGGVVAANLAVQKFTGMLTDYVILFIRQDNQRHRLASS